MRRPLLLIASGIFFSACAARAPISPAPSEVATPTPTPAEVMTKSKMINLLELNKSGQTGSAVLDEVDGKLKVTIKLAGKESKVAQPAHIHIGSCPIPGAVKYPLTNVVSGVSETMLDMSLADLLAMGDLAINVHKSAAEVKVYTSCGDVK